MGSMVGALVGGLQCQFLGRKKSLIIDNVVVFIGLVGLTFSYSFPALLLFRFILGFSVASLFVNVPSYTGEICQPKVRSLTGSFIMFCNSGGMCTMMVIGATVKWRTALLVISAFPVLVILLLIIFVPESPIWLVMNNKVDAAKASLVRLRGNMLIVESELARIQASLKIQKEESLEENNKSCCSGMKEIVDALRDKSFLKPFSILVFLHCIGFEWIGLAFIAYYMVGILIEAEIPFDPYLACAGIALFRFSLMIIFAFAIANRVKRRPMFLTTAIAEVIGLLGIATYFLLKKYDILLSDYPSIKWLPVASIMLVYAGFAMGYGSVPYMLQGEILPPYARAIGSGLLGLLSNCSMFVATKVGPTITTNIGMDGAFYLHSAVAIMTLVFAYFTIPETFNMSLEDIEKIYRTKGDNLLTKPLRSRKTSSASIISFYEMNSPYNK